MQQSLVSIIIVTLNAEGHLERCLKSIFDQSYPRIEVIVIDGGSIDKTTQILESHSSSISYWKSEPDTGIFNAMNKGINQASGDWLYFLGGDDFLFPGFSELAGHLKYPDTIYYGACLWGNQILGERFTPYRLTRECICHQGILYPSAVFEKYRYSEKYRVSGDHLLNIQCWGDPLFRKHYFPLLIANFSKGGLSSCENDREFLSEFPSIIRKYLGSWTYLRYIWKLYKNRRKARG
jgi:glycosyltransferase involved in cell wall biosynthesis